MPTENDGKIGFCFFDGGCQDTVNGAKPNSSAIWQAHSVHHAEGPAESATSVGPANAIDNGHKTSHIAVSSSDEMIMVPLANIGNQFLP